MYCYMGALGEGPAYMVSRLLKLPIASHFNRPYLSSSLRDFWGNRWNLVVADSLRWLYDPIVEGMTALRHLILMTLAQH